MHGDACNGECRLDSDGDHISEIDEVDDNDLLTTPPDTDEDMTADYLDQDSDNDGISDHQEAGDDKLETPPIHSDQDDIPDFRDPDSDNDGIGDNEDNCRVIANAEQHDRDGDSIGDACSDLDADAVPDTIDNCVDVANDQDDLDGDGLGDACDPDVDNDGIVDNFGVGGGGCGCDSGDAPLGGMFCLLVVFLFWRRRLDIAVIFGLVATTTPARAQTAPIGDIPIERFRLASDGHGIFDVEWAGIPAHRSWHLAMWAGVANDPLVLYAFPNDERTRVGSLVSERAESGLVASLALWDRVQLGLAADVVVYQHRDDAIGGFMSSESLPAGGIGDLRLIPKVKIWGQCDPLCLAFIPAVTVPTGSADGHLRETGVTFVPELAASGVIGPLRVSSNVGYRVRKRTEVPGLVVDDELYLRAGLSYRFTQLSGTELGATLASATAASSPFSETHRNAFEMLFGVTQSVWGDIDAMLGGGAGLGAGFGTPDWRVILGARMNIGDNPRARPLESPQNAFGRLRGRVTHPDSTAQPTRVVIRFDDTDRPATELMVAADGTFELAEVVPGAGTASSGGPGLRPCEQRFVMEAQKTVEIVLACSLPEGHLRGSIRAFDGSPVPATVSIQSPAREVVANAEGLFELALPIGSHQVVIAADGFQTQIRTITVLEDGVTVLNIDLRKGRTPEKRSRRPEEQPD